MASRAGLFLRSGMNGIDWVGERATVRSARRQCHRRAAERHSCANGWRAFSSPHFVWWRFPRGRRHCAAGSLGARLLREKPAVVTSSSTFSTRIPTSTALLRRCRGTESTCAMACHRGSKRYDVCRYPYRSPSPESGGSAGVAARKPNSGSAPRELVVSPITQQREASFATPSGNTTKPSGRRAWKG